MAIEYTIQEARTADALGAKGQIIATIKKWHQTVQENDWILDEWDDEFKDWLRPILHDVAGSVIVKQ